MTKDFSAIIRQAYDCDQGVGYAEFIDKTFECDAVKVFDSASSLSLSEDTKDRVLAAGILRWFNRHTSPFHSEAVDILIKLLADADDGVVTAAVYALSDDSPQKAVPALLKLIDHPDGFLREGIAGLITLSRDEDCDVRMWAVAGLVTGSNIDSKDIREALKARLSDDIEIRGEAILGLVKRGDKTLADLILLELQSSELDCSIIEAAGLVGGADHKAALLSLKGQLKGDEVDFYGYEIDLAISQLS